MFALNGQFVYAFIIGKLECKVSESTEIFLEVLKTYRLWMSSDRCETVRRNILKHKTRKRNVLHCDALKVKTVNHKKCNSQREKKVNKKEKKS